ncbi:MAG: hypothetical protein ABI863_21535 [Ginsengibacter sp.]
MKSTIKAALQGPELKKANINGHEFNIKPVSYRIYKGEITVFGQLSHCLSLRVDDQVWYTFRKKGAIINPTKPNEMVVKKEEGGVIATIEKAKDVVGLIAGIFGVDSDKYFDKLKELSSDLSFVDFDGDWEKAASSFLTELADSATIPAMPQDSGLKLFQDYNMTGNSYVIKLDHDVAKLQDLGWNDKASSFYAVVPEGKKLTLHQHPDYKGLVLEFGPGSHIIHDLNIHNFNDGLSSVRWEKP